MKGISAIIAAGGIGKRMGADVPKQCLCIKDKPIIAYSVEKLNKIDDIKEIIVVCPKDFKTQIQEILSDKNLSKKIKNIVDGGTRRQDSVKNGIEQVSDDIDYVLIHDAVRPFIKEEILNKLIKQAYECGSAILGVRVKSTIKKCNGHGIVMHTVDRTDLWEVQTPQVFRKDLLLACYKKDIFSHRVFTDEAMMIEELGNSKVVIVEGEYSNIKITTKEDLVLAEAMVGTAPF